MNLANKLTVFRVVLLPFFVFVLLAGEKIMSVAASNYVATGIFLLASITDLFDGMIARKYNQITNFGKFMDPLADKLLVCSALVCLSAKGMIPVWITVIIICREFAVSGLRLIAVERGKVIAANMFGKIKTFETMAMIVAVMLDLDNVISGFTFWYYFEQILIYAALVLTVLSMVIYFARNGHILKEDL